MRLCVAFFNTEEEIEKVLAGVRSLARTAAR